MHRYGSGPKEGLVFYVGKGCGSRCKSKSGRSVHWLNIVNKYDFVYEICQNEMTEESAFLLEEWLIAKLRHYRVGICNISSGGDGGSLTLEHRKKLSEIKKGVKMSTQFRSNQSARMKGKRYRLGTKVTCETKKKISDKKKREGTYTYDPNIYSFYNSETGDVFVGTYYDFTLKFSLHPPSVSKMKNGHLKSHKGWRKNET